MVRLRKLTWAAFALGVTLSHQNCSNGFKMESASVEPPSSEAACTNGDAQTGYARTSALSPQSCGALITKTCVNGVWDTDAALAPACSQYCRHPSDDSPQLSGTHYVTFTSATGATQAACDGARVTSVCDAATGTFLPAPSVNLNCLVVGQPCPYSNGAGRAVPTGNAPNSTVTGYAQTSATYPALCGAQVTRTCQVSGSWNGAVPLYETCQQNCVHPDDGNPVPAGTAYGAYYTRNSGTQAECDAARVAAGSSTCNATTGTFLPALPAARYATCTVVNAAKTLTCPTLKSDATAYSMPTVAKPGYLQSYTDPVFGTKITRITGDAGSSIASGGKWGTDVHHQYSKIQAFNADQSLIFIETNRDGGGTGGVFLDGDTYQPVISAGCPGSSCLWHPTDPNKMIYVTSSAVGSWNPRTGVKTTIATFSGYTGLLFGQYEGNLSLDGRKVAFDGYNSSGKFVGFAYDLVDKTKYPDVDLKKWGTQPDSISISAKGNYMIINYEDSSTNVVVDLNGNLVASLPAGVPDHYDLTVDANGDEVAVGSGRNSTYNGRMVKVRLRDGAVTSLTFAGGYGSHTSTRGTNLQTWGVSNIFSSSGAFKNEIMTYSLEGNKVYRLAHDHNPSPDYEAETHPMQSPDGLRILFASAWGAAGNRPVSVYVIDLRDKCGN